MKYTLAILTLFLTNNYALATPPNLLLVVVDDMGWSDTQPFGGEINTPTINTLAAEGVMMTDFYVAPTCSPTRAMLLTGIDHHRAGLGTMDKLQTPNQIAHEGYQGQLLDSVVTLPEALRTKGYQTYLSGKWHLSTDSSQHPHRRGFDRSFTLLEGGASHFGDMKPLHANYHTSYLEDGQATTVGRDFYSSIGYTDKMLEYLESADPNKPFFAYLAYTAPHDPLQVPDSWLNQYRGKYDQGPEATRKQRLKRQQKMGLVASDIELWQSPIPPKWLPLYKKPWPDRSNAQRSRDARSMEIYASMIELMDQQFGRVIDYLKATSKLENTYVVFLSDNGANALTPLMYPDTNRDWLLTQRNHNIEQLGRPGSHLHLGQEWATTANTPWKMYKGTVGEGGIRSPFIVRGPKLPENRISHQLGHARDIVPTLYQLLGFAPTESPLYRGKQSPQGQSLVNQWHGNDSRVRPLMFELFGNQAVRLGHWKAHLVNRPIGSGQWELYDLSTDPGENHNLAKEHPKKLKQLVSSYQKYHLDNNVISPIPPKAPTLDSLYTGECDWACEIKFFVAGQLIKLQ